MSGSPFGYALTDARATFSTYLGATKALAPKTAGTARTEAELATYPGDTLFDLYDDFFDHANGVFTGARQMLGPLLIGSATADAADKDAYVLGKHRTNAEESILAIAALARVANNYVDIGGGSASHNAATDIRFYTGSTTTTTTGTLRGTITNGGVLSWVGSISVGGTLSVAVDLSVSDDLAVLGDASISGSLAVDSDATIGGPLLLGTPPTDATDKDAIVAGKHRTNAEEPILAIAALSRTTNSYVDVGGGTASYNAATDIRFFTAANITTTAGTIRGIINGSGGLSWYGVITLDSASPTLTVGSGAGAPIVAVVSAASSLAALHLGPTSNTDEGGVVYDDSGNYLGLRCTDAIRWVIDSGSAFRPYAAGYNIGSTSVGVNQIHGSSSPTDATDKSFGLYTLPRTVAQGAVALVESYTDSSNNLLLVGGGLGGDGPTEIRVSTASALNTAPTARTTVKATGFLLHAYALGLSGVISPATLGTTQDNWDPTSNGSVAAIRVTPDASGTSLSGLVPKDTDGRLVLLLNIGSATLTLVHDATSTAANRFLCPNSTNLAIPANGSRWIWYDTTSARWRVLGAVA